MLNNHDTSLYSIMDYYIILLTGASNKICSIITPFGKYKCNHLPMGVCIEPYFFQWIIVALINNLDIVRFTSTICLSLNLAHSSSPLLMSRRLWSNFSEMGSNERMINASFQYQKYNNWYSLLHERVSKRTRENRNSYRYWTP